MLLAAAQDLPLDPAAGGRLRHEFGNWQPPLVAVSAPAPPPALPDWTGQPASPAPAELRVILPSDLGGAKTLPGEAPGDPEALLRGTILHGFLERFPSLDDADRVELAQAWPVLAARAEALIGDPGLAWLFGPDTLAEVGFVLHWDGGLLTGTMDRLVINPDRVLVVDFKSNAVVPTSAAEVPEGYLRQMGAYAHAASALYPGRQVEVAILWTEGPVLMPLDPEIVRSALQRAARA